MDRESFDLDRPNSELLIDIHVYVVPSELWRNSLKSAANQIINEAISAGFIRVMPETVLRSMREELEGQLGFDVVPQDFVFLRSVGRCLTRIRPKQENQLKAKNFIPPHAYAPELFVLEATPEIRNIPYSGASSQSYGSYSDRSDFSGHKPIPPIATNHIAVQTGDWQRLQSQSRPRLAIRPPHSPLPEVVSKQPSPTLHDATPLPSPPTPPGNHYSPLPPPPRARTPLTVEECVRIDDPDNNLAGQDQGPAPLALLNSSLPHSPLPHSTDPWGESLAEQRPQEGRQQYLPPLSASPPASPGPRGHSQSQSQSSSRDQHALNHSGFSDGPGDPTDGPGDPTGLSDEDKQKIQNLISNGDKCPKTTNSAARSQLSKNNQEKHLRPQQSQGGKLKQSKTANYPNPGPLHSKPKVQNDARSESVSGVGKGVARTKRGKPGQGRKSVKLSQTHEDIIEAEPENGCETFEEDYQSSTTRTDEVLHLGLVDDDSCDERRDEQNLVGQSGQRQLNPPTFGNDSTNRDPYFQRNKPHNTSMSPSEDIRRENHSPNSNQIAVGLTAPDVRGFPIVTAPMQVKQSTVKKKQSHSPSIEVIKDPTSLHSRPQSPTYHTTPPPTRDSPSPSHPNRTPRQRRQKEDERRQREEVDRLQREEEENRREEARRKKEEEDRRIDEDRRRWEEEERRRKEEEENRREIDRRRKEDEERQRREDEERRKAEEAGDNDQSQWADEREIEEEENLRKRRLAEERKLTLEREAEERRRREEEERRRKAQLRSPTPPPVDDQGNREEEMARLRDELERLQQERELAERQREELVKKAKQLQLKTKQRRNQARDVWKKKYFEEKKRTPPLEEQCKKLQQELESLHRRIMSQLENSKEQTANRGDNKPSQQNNLKIQATRLQHDIEDLQRRVDNIKMKLTTEMKLRSQAEAELRALRAELTQKKISVTLTAKGSSTAIPPPHPTDQHVLLTPRQHATLLTPNS